MRSETTGGVMESESTSQSKLYKHINKLREQLDEYLQELPVLGFNSGKYDINVMKRYLYPVLQETDPQNREVEVSRYHKLSCSRIQLREILEGVRLSSDQMIFPI